MPWDPLEERFRDLDLRLGEVERGPYLCRHCTTPYNSELAALACCDDPEDTPT